MTSAGHGTHEIMADDWQVEDLRMAVAGALYGRGHVDGLVAYDKTRPPGIAPIEQHRVEEVVALTLKPPPHEATHWTLRAMAKGGQCCGLDGADDLESPWPCLRISFRQFKLSNDPADLCQKLHDIVGLYVSPPAHAVVLSIDEKSQIQALDRTQPGLPLKKGRGATMTHDYKRNGTTTLFAALNVLDGTVIGQNMQRPQTSGVHSLSSTRLNGPFPKTRQSTPLLITMQPTRRTRCKNGWHVIPDGHSTSPPHQARGSTPSKVSLRN